MGLDAKQQAACREVLDAVLSAKDGRSVLIWPLRPMLTSTDG